MLRVIWGYRSTCDWLQIECWICVCKNIMYYNQTYLILLAVCLGAPSLIQDSMKRQLSARCCT